MKVWYNQHTHVCIPVKAKPRAQHMMTSSYGNIFHVTDHLYVAGEFPPQKPVTRSFDVFFDLRPN